MRRYLVRHDIAEKHNMSWIDYHIMRLHGVLDFINDGPPCCFDAKYLCSLNNMIRRGLFTHNT